MNNPNDIVGHKTFATGEICHETGFPAMRHEPLTRAEADAMWHRAERCQEARAMTMPTEQDALHSMFDAWQRLKELGWCEGKYCPRDGSTFRVIELGSTGIFDGDCSGEWPHCTWTTYDETDAYPSSQAPALFKLYPEDQAKYDARMASAREHYKRLNECQHDPCACMDAGMADPATCDFVGHPRSDQ